MRHIIASLKHSNRKPRHNQDGVALITTMLLLLLLTAMSLTLVFSVSSDMLLTGYYGNYRGSFYAADSGLNIARQQVINSLKGSIPVPFTATSSPLPSSAPSTAAGAGSTGYTSFTPINSTSSWPEKVKITNVVVATPPTTPAVGCSVSGGPAGATCANPCPTSCASNPVKAYIYTIPYSITAVGQSQGTEIATLTDNGVINLTANTGLGPTNQSFAGFGMFIDQYALCSGDLVPGEITGPVWTNGSWNFSNAGSYTYTDPVNQVGATSGYDNGSCAGYTKPPSGFSVTFQQGINLGVSPAPLPTDSFNQEQAVIDGIGLASGAPTNAALNAALKDASGKAFPTGGASTGVFLPYTVNASTGAKTFTGGGILVEGNAAVTLSPGSTSTAQVYTIVQGATTTTVTIDPMAGSAGTTTISSPLGSQTINGVPEQFTSSGTAEGPATMLYVNGSITALTGPGQGKTAINNDTALTITAADNVTITGDILYATEPVYTNTTASNFDQLNPSGNTGQVLGIFTATGNVQLANTQSNNNLEIDASIATISQGGSGGIVNTGSGINTLTIVGGRIQNTIQDINSTTRNVVFDRRFSGGNFAPPWFPSTTITTTSGTQSVVSTVQRTQWVNKTLSQ
jgi:Tfp pilus assembly protein PilX